MSFLLRRSFYCWIFVYAWICATGQTVTEGSAWTIEKGTFPVQFAGIAYNKLHLIRGNASEHGIVNDVWIEQLDQATLVKTGEWRFPGLFNNRQLFYPEDISVWNKKLWIFASSYDKELRQNKLLMQEITPEGKLLPASQLSASETDHFAHNKRRFLIGQNPGADLLLVLSLNDRVEDKIAGIHFTLFDTALRVVKQMKADLAYSGRFPEIVDFSVDEPGNLQLLLRSQRSADSTDIAWSLYAFPVMNEDIAEYQLDIPEKQISSLRFELSPDDHLLVAGLVRESFQPKNEVSSVFFLKINRESGAIVSRDIKKLDSNFMGLFSGELPTPDRKDFGGVEMRQLIPLGDGGAMLLAEKQFSEEICQSDFRSGVIICSQHFYSSTILAIRYTKNGEMDWFQHIPKRQHTQDDEGSFLSFASIAGDRGLLFLYNGPSRNKAKEDEEMNAPDRSRLVATLLDASGQLQSVHVPERTGSPIYTGFSFVSKDGLFMISQPDRATNRLIRISF